MDKLLVEMLSSIDVNTALILLLLLRVHLRVSKLEVIEEIRQKA